MSTNMSKAVDAFVEALQAYLPNVQFTSSRSFYNGEEPASASVELRFAKGIMTDKPHKLSSATQLIHYTSLPVLFEMVKSARFRLYGADKQNDPLELVHILEDVPDLKVDELKSARSNFFIGSFCAYEKEQEESFPMWRYYGQSGQGVAIVFKLVNDDTDNWLNYSLGRIAYKTESESSSKLKELFQLVRSYQQAANYKIDNIPSLLYAYALFNKTGVWAEEREVRLMHYRRMNRLEWLWDDQEKDIKSDVFPSVTAGGSIRYFTELRLDLKKFRSEIGKIHQQKEVQEMAFNLWPALKIEKVIMGYNYSSEQIYELEENLAKLAGTTLGYSFPLVSSNLTKYFAAV